MPIKIEDMLPGVKENGLNTAVAVDFSLAPTMSVPAGVTISGTSVAPVNISSASATALTAGLSGTSNPGFVVDASTGTSATGVKIKSAAAGGGVAISTISSGTDESLTIDARGAGTIALNGTATGIVTSPRVIKAVTATAATAGGVKAFGMGTSTVGIFWGSGTPTISAGQGSLYLCTDGSSSSTRLFVNSNGSTTWVAITTAT